MPVMALSISCNSYMHAMNPWGSDPSGCLARNSGSIAYVLQALGLYFMVHEPKG
jgi:hypothetical protein